MKTIFDESTRTELVARINSLHENSTRQWGKMTVWQMAKHCTIWNDWVLGKNNLNDKQSLLGLVFGKMALKSSVKDDTPMKQGMPAGNLAVKEKAGDIELQKKKWIEGVIDYAHFSNEGFVHDFFGKMTKEEIGIFAYKHFDHHLRQFGA